MKLYNYELEEFKLKPGTLEELKKYYGKQPVYLTHDKKNKEDKTPKIWRISLERTEENKSRTWIVYTSGYELNFENLAYSLGYLYNENELSDVINRGRSRFKSEKEF